MQQIFVGDVQGCAEEFEELVERARARFGSEHELWLVGDLINRGPANLRLLQQVRDLVAAGRCHFILGNHEVGLLRVALGLQSLRPTDSFSDVLDAPDAADWLHWLRQQPLTVTGQLGQQQLIMVHAGVHPDWSLEDIESKARRVEARLREDDPAALRALLTREGDESGTDISGDELDSERDWLGLLTRCRGFSEKGGWSSAEPERAKDAWHRHWSKRQHEYGIVYGHWSLQGLHVAPGLRGLDTGCVHHARGRNGYLTAWLPDPEAARPFDLPDENFWQILARRAYYLEMLESTV